MRFAFLAFMSCRLTFQSISPDCLICFNYGQALPVHSEKVPGNLTSCSIIKPLFAMAPLIHFLILFLSFPSWVFSLSFLEWPCALPPNLSLFHQISKLRSKFPFVTFRLSDQGNFFWPISWRRDKHPNWCFEGQFSIFGRHAAANILLPWYDKIGNLNAIYEFYNLHG